MIPFAVACAIALALTPIVRKLAIRFGVIDVPNARSSHDRITARSGGNAIVAAIVITALALRAGEPIALGTLLVIAAIGVVDDVRRGGVSAAVRFLIHCGAALLAMFGGGYVIRSIDLPWGGAIGSAVFGVPLTLLFIVGLTNAYNFMDGINGIASLEAIVAGIALGVLALQRNDPHAAVLAFAVAGAAAGFLPFNFPRASIFMGDVASGALGVILALLVIRVSNDGASLWAAVLPLSPFITDTSITLVRRLLRGERVYAAHRSHFYQRLNILGWPHARVSLLWAFFAALGGGAAIAWCTLGPAARTASLIVVLCVQIAAFLAIHRAERAKMHRSNG